MKKQSRLVWFCGVTLAAGLAFGAPRPEYVPANADIVFVADNPLDRKHTKAFEAAVRAAGGDLDGLRKTDQPSFMDLLPEQGKIVMREAFGLSDDGNFTKVRAMTVSVSFLRDPSIERQSEATTLKTQVAVYAFVENREVNLPALNAAMKEWVADQKAKGKDEGIELVTEGAWTALKVEGEPKADEPLYLGWRSYAEGLVFAVTPTLAKAEALVAGKAETLKADDPLAEIFKAPATDGEWSRLAVRDLGGLVTRFTEDSEEARQKIALSVPWLTKVRRVMTTSYYASPTLFTSKVEAQMADPENAGLLRDALMGYRALLSQMFIPMVTQNPASATAKAIAGIGVASEGAVTTVSMDVSAQTTAAVINEIVACLKAQAEREAMQEAAQRQAEEAKDDEAKALSDGTTPPMSEDEAREILKSLEP